MSYDWTEFLILAEELLRNPGTPGPEEASLRSAVSRAYYAAFKIALGSECAQGTYSGSGYGTDHVALPKHFQASDDVLRRDIGIKLDRLRLNRVEADYRDVLKGDPKALAQASVMQARQIIQALDSL